MQFTKTSNPFDSPSATPSVTPNGPESNATTSPASMAAILLPVLASLAAFGGSIWNLFQARELNWTTDGFLGYAAGWLGLGFLALILAVVALITTFVARKHSSRWLTLLGCVPILFVAAYAAFIFCVPA